MGKVPIETTNIIRKEKRMTLYQRYDCIFSAEGKIPQHILTEMLSPYTVVEPPEDALKGGRMSLALITQLPCEVRVYNNLAHLTQQYTGIYVSSGDIDEASLAALRADTTNFIVDFSGHLIFGPTEKVRKREAKVLGQRGNSTDTDLTSQSSEYSRSMVGKGKKEIYEGRIFLCQAKEHGDPPQSDIRQPIWDHHGGSLDLPRNSKKPKPCKKGPRQVSKDSTQPIWACTMEDLERLAQGKEIIEADPLTELNILLRLTDEEIGRLVEQSAPEMWHRASRKQRRKLIQKYRNRLKKKRADLLK